MVTVLNSLPPPSVSLGYTRLVCKEHLVTEAKPDNFIQDMWLDTPFPELVALKESYDFATMGKKAHSHVPYVVILLAFLDKWKALHGSSPLTYKEKVKFRDFVDEGRLKNEDGVPLTEENFEEARKVVVKTLGVNKVSLDLLLDRLIDWLIDYFLSIMDW